MIAVFWKRGCSRIMAASSKPSSSGMQTSIRTTATSFLSRNSSASRAEVALIEVLAELAQDHLVGEQLGRLIVDQQDVDLVVSHHRSLHGQLSDAATCATRRAAARC